MHVCNRKKKATDKKGIKLGSIGKENDNNPGYGVSVHQLQAA